jgi:hypothetical protein
MWRLPTRRRAARPRTLKGPLSLWCGKPRTSRAQIWRAASAIQQGVTGAPKGHSQPIRTLGFFRLSGSKKRRAEPVLVGLEAGSPADGLDGHARVIAHRGLVIPWPTRSPRFAALPHQRLVCAFSRLDPIARHRPRLRHVERSQESNLPLRERLRHHQLSEQEIGLSVIGRIGPCGRARALPRLRFTQPPPWDRELAEGQLEGRITAIETTRMRGLCQEESEERNHGCSVSSPQPG